MNPAKIINIAHMRRLAKRRLPGFVFDMIEGGVEDEHGVARNVEALARHLLQYRVLVDIQQRNQKTTLFDREFDSPFGISATGPAPIYRRGADQLLCTAATQNNIPFILSGVSGASLETIASIGGANAWFQLYAARDRGISADMIHRITDAGFEVMVVTVDTPLQPKRERHLKNGITTPLKFKPSVLLRLAKEAMLHPAWMAEYVLKGGMPMLETWQKYAPAGASAMEVAEYFNSQAPSNQTWKDLEEFRRLWKGKLVVKGICHPEDAVRAVELGADGITVSNHGAKVLDRAPATIDVLPVVKAAVGDTAKVFFDGGIRRGSDIAVAKCLGADFVFTGRATLYGVSAAGLPGANRAIEILRHELDLILATLGCPEFAKLDQEFLFSQS